MSPYPYGSEPFGQSPVTIVLRHRKENLKKCSLRGLESRSDFLFLTYPADSLPDLSEYISLTLDAPPLTREDSCRGLFLIDATWRYAETMQKSIAPLHGVVPRSIPSEFRTAYPRKQTECSDPERGLASLEALYIAYRMMGREAEKLLESYYWRARFLEINSHLFNCYESRNE